MSTTTSQPRIAPWRQRFEGGLGSWPAFAAAWSLHLGLLLYVFFSKLPTGKLGVLELVAVPIGLAALTTLEIGVAIALAAALDSVSANRGWALAIDLVKTIAVTAVLTILVTSSIKFVATSVHLKLSDLWFAYTNFRQILQEAQLLEALTLLALPAGAVVVALLLFRGLRRRRQRGRCVPSRRFALVLGGCVVVLALAHGVSVVLPQVLEGMVPEGHWATVRRAHTRFLNTAVTGPAPSGARPITAYDPGAEGRRLNVVVVMLESVPWKRTFLGPDGRREAMPNLARLAEESVVFERAYAVSTHSDYAQMAILSSLHPRKYQRHDYYIDIEYPRTLIWDALGEAGYATSMFSCQNERWGNMLAFLDTPGLDVFRHSLDWPRAPKKGRGLESKVYEETPISEWRRWRRRVKGPYFSYLNFQSNHFPYEVPADAPRPFAPYELDFAASFLSYPESRVPVMLNRFDNALHYADRKIAEVVDFLKEIGDWDSTVLVVVSDHGEAFYEHGQPTHGTALFEEQVRSLWMMRVPGATPRTVAEPVSLLDVAPTLLEQLGLAPHGNFQGRGDVLGSGYDGDERPLFFTIQGLTQEDGVLLGGTKLILNWDRQGKALFDLTADPGETLDLALERPDRLHALEQVLAAFLRQQLSYYEERRWNEGYYPARLP